LIGHSFGGLAAINNLLEAPLFNAYIANDPSLWWDSELLIRKAKLHSRILREFGFFWRRPTMRVCATSKMMNMK
jgi:predicted alpha/beta superfamily hydrolase